MKIDPLNNDNDEKFQCQYCSKYFTLKGNYVRHTKTCHLSTNEPRFKCYSCDKSFKRKDYLIKHFNLQKVCWIQFICKHCARTFKSRKNWSKHELKCSVDKVAPSFTCEFCGSTYTRKDKLKKHNLSECWNSRTRKTPCLVENCEKVYYHKSHLIDHLQSAHDDLIVLSDYQHKQFSSIEEFNSWKEAEEEKTFSYFSVNKTLSNVESSARVKYLYCQHDGSSRCCNKRTRRRNLESRVKMDHNCIAKMKMWTNEDNKIEVKYFPTHSHQTSLEDLYHHPLSQSTNNNKFINQQISLQVSPSKNDKQIVNSSITDTSNTRNKLHSVENAIITKKRIFDRTGIINNVSRVYLDDTKGVLILPENLEKSENLLISESFIDHPFSVKSEDLSIFPPQTKDTEQPTVKKCVDIKNEVENTVHVQKIKDNLSYINAFISEESNKQEFGHNILEFVAASVNTLVTQIQHFNKRNNDEPEENKIVCSYEYETLSDLEFNS